MTIKVKANGLTFSFPDGTTTVQIEEVLNEHFNPESKAEAFFTEVGKVLATATAKAAGSASDLLVPDIVKTGAHAVLPEDIYNAYFDPEKLAQDKGLTPETKAGQVASEILPAVAGGFGGSVGLARSGFRAGNKLFGFAADNLASSVGAQVASGHDVTAGTTAGDVALGTAINLAMPKVGGALKAILRGKREGEFVDAIQQLNGKIEGDFVPSRGMTTMNPITLTTEKQLENSLGASGRMAAFNESNQKALDEFADKMRLVMAGAVTDSQQLGDDLAKAYKSFVESGEANADKYFDMAIQRAGNHRVQFNKTRRELNKITASARNNPHLAEVIQSPQFKTLIKALTARGGTDLQGVMDLKGAISEMIKGTGQGTKSTSKRSLTRLYNAINEDTSRSLTSAPMGAAGVWEEGNRVYAALQREIEKVNQVFDGAAGDTLYARIFGKPSDALMISNADKVRAILSVLPEEARRRVKSEMVFRAGREAAGQSGNEGRKFSAAAFLTNWTKLKENGLADLLTGSHYADIEALSVISHRMKELGKAANHSNTANHLNASNIMQGVAGMASGGMSLPVTALMANLSARALTNPEFASTLWKLASSSQNDGGAVRALIRLAVIAEQDPETAVDYQILADGLSK